jgi:cyanophycin synthetase
MQFRKVLALRGPNIWASFPVIEAWVDLGPWKDRPSDAIAGFNDRLMAWLPGMIEHECSLGERGGFFSRLRSGTYMAHILEHVVLELQALAGVDVSFGRAREASEDGVVRVVFKYRDEVLARECLEEARLLCLAAAQGTPYDAAAAIVRLRGIAEDNLLGPSTNSIVQAARRRNIPWKRLNRYSLVQLGYGVKQQRIRAAETSLTGAIAEGIAQDKDLTRNILLAAGVPAPEGYPVTDAADAWETALYIGLPVVVKPQDGNQGRGVTTNLTTREQVEAAYASARERSDSVLVEKYIPGCDFRLLIVGGKLVAAARRDPARVIGDGVHTVRQLVDAANQDPRRAEGHSNVLSKIHIDDIGLHTLAGQGLTPDSIPQPGRTVLIRRNANLSTGGTATDVTDQVHPEVAARAIEAAQAVGLDVAGIDVIAGDIARPLEEQGGVVVEVNAAPGLRMHLAPSEGQPRDVGQAIVEMLYPPGDDGRIPVAAVTGVNGKTTVTRFLAHILRAAGLFVGMTCTDGIFLGERRIDDDDCSGPISAGMVLSHPSVQAAVLETARGGILRAGLGFDQCRAAIVTNIADGDHLGLSDVNTPEDLAQVKRCIVEAVAPDGAAILNANDPLTVAMAPYCPGRVIYFSPDDANPVIASHLSAGGSAAFVRGSSIILAEGSSQTELTSLDRVPMTRGGRVPFEVENALAAIAGAWAMGAPLPAIAAAAATFATDLDGAPGRFNVLDVRGATVIVDYGHNAAALRALVESFNAFPHTRRLALYTMAGDRRDSDIILNGRILGDSVDHVILYEAYTIRGRAPGEIASLMRQGLALGRRVRRIDEVDDPKQAITFALDQVRPGELLLLQADYIDEAVDLVRDYLRREAQGASHSPAPIEAVGSSLSFHGATTGHACFSRPANAEAGRCAGILLEAPAGAKLW